MNKEAVLSLILAMASFAALCSASPLAVHPTNPRFFTDGSGDAIYLTGSHTWYLIHTNADDMSPDNSYHDMIDYLDFMQSHGQNFVRLWTGWSIGSGPFPWQRPGPGTASDGLPQFDMTQFDQTYFDNLETWIQELDSRGMYASVMFYGSGRALYSSSWTRMAWHEDNNINTELDSFSSSDGTSFFSPNSQALNIQRMTVRKFIDELNGYDNIIWEIINEAPIESISWQRNMADYAISYESSNYPGREHLVGITGGDSYGSQLLTGNHQWFSPDLYSMGYYEGGDADYTDKIAISDTDHIRNPANDGWGYSEIRFVPAMKEWVWETFTRGNHPIFMDWYDNYDPDPDYGQTNIDQPGEVNHAYDPVRDAMGHTLSYASRMNLADMIPSDSYSQCSTTYCLRNPGSEYLIYQPGSGDFTVNLVAGNYDYEWFDPDAGTVHSSGTMAASGGSHNFKNPLNSDVVLYLSSSSPLQTCSDGTPYGSCVSGNPPLYCDSSGQLIDSCGTPGNCGCPSGQACSSGTCQDISTDLIPQSGWTLQYVDSEELSGEDGSATNAFDGNPNTIWHTEWSGDPDPPHPHEIQISLGGAYVIRGFRYLPRQDGEENGMISGYEFHVSQDGSDWGAPASQGSFTNNPSEQEVTFQPVAGQFVRLVALSEVSGNPWTSMAELNALGTPVSSDGTCDGLAALWHLDGNADDSSGNKHNGTANGASQTTGRFGQAYSFDGSDDYISFGDSELATNDITISLWVRPDDLANNQGYIISKYNSDTDEREYAVFLNGPSNTLSLLTSNPAGDVFTSADVNTLSSLLANGTWSSIVLTRSGSSVECYVDGISQSFSSNDIGTNDFMDTSSPLLLGDRANGDRAFNGSIDEVAIWDRALSLEEVQDIHSSGQPVTCQPQPIHRADASGDGCIDSQELSSFINLFYRDSTAYPMGELMEAVGLWKAGTGC